MNRLEEITQEIDLATARGDELARLKALQIKYEYYGWGDDPGKAQDISEGIQAECELVFD